MPPLTRTPSTPLKAIVLAAPAMVPPMVLLLASTTLDAVAGVAQVGGAARRRFR